MASFTASPHFNLRCLFRAPSALWSAVDMFAAELDNNDVTERMRSLFRRENNWFLKIPLSSGILFKTVAITGPLYLFTGLTERLCHVLVVCPDNQNPLCGAIDNSLTTLNIISIMAVSTLMIKQAACEWSKRKPIKWSHVSV